MEGGEKMTVERGESFDHLRERSLGLPQVLFQSITHMGPGLAVAFSLLVGFSFAVVTLLAALYYQYNPLPDYPILLGDWFALAWLLAGLLALALVTAARPRAIEATRDIFVEDEPPGER